MGYGDVAGEQPVEQVPGQVRREADPETARVARRSHGHELARVGDEEVVGTGDADGEAAGGHPLDGIDQIRSEEHTSELQSLMRTSYAVFCLKKKKTTEK